ncbi:MAG: response regulator transcription factor [Pseudomonadota bacterium]
MRVLIIEDEQQIREALCTAVRDSGFAVESAADGEEGLYFATEYPIDIAIIDLGLPGMSGMDVIRQAREAGKGYPILILTARDRWQDKVEGLQAGADDYVVKPFHTEEVLARLNALMRRSGGFSEAVLRAGAIALDTRSQVVTVDEKTVELTSFEYRVLEYLMLKNGKVVSKSELTESLYDQDYERDSNVIEVFVGRLRKKLDPENKIKPIETLRGRGYRFALSAEATG